MKFKRADEQFFARRAAFSKKHGIAWEQTDNWPLYCGFGNLARYVAIQKIVERSMTIPGNVAEFGVYRGSNLLYVAKLLKLLDPMGWKEVHGFDAFEGLTTFTPEDRAATEFQGAYAGNYELLKDLIEMHELLDDVILHKGLIQNTFPKLIEDRPEISFSLVFLDTDLYEPTKTVLDRMHDMLSTGGIIVFDEWNYERYPGETKAVREFLAKHGSSYRMEHPINTRHPTLMLVKHR